MTRQWLDDLKFRIFHGESVTSEEFIELRKTGYDTFFYDPIRDMWMERVSEVVRQAPANFKAYMSEEWRKQGHLPTPQTTVLEPSAVQSDGTASDRPVE